MRVKLCGITNRDDAISAMAFDIAALGFIFYPHSPRYISPDVVEAIMLDVPPLVHMVGVFVNHDPKEIHDIAKRCKLTTIQLHGDESPAYCTQFDVPVIKALAVKEDTDIQRIAQYKGTVSGILLDTKVDQAYGGTGKTFDWGLAIAAKDYDVPLLLSGGINANNIAKAVKLVNPYGVDICSGVEREPGVKDYQKIQTLFDTLQSV